MVEARVVEEALQLQLVVLVLRGVEVVAELEDMEDEEAPVELVDTLKLVFVEGVEEVPIIIMVVQVPVA
jgi:hypothetical protein